LLGGSEGEARRSPARAERLSGAGGDRASPVRTGLWEQFLSRENLVRALRRVEQNAGAAGIDGMTVAELRPWLKEQWPEIRGRLEAGT
jgi:RNA-directed DNA polymerase